MNAYAAPEFKTAVDAIDASVVAISLGIQGELKNHQGYNSHTTILQQMDTANKLLDLRDRMILDHPEEKQPPDSPWPPIVMMAIVATAVAFMIYFACMHP